MAKTIFYKDLSLDFIPHPISGDVRAVTDETAVRRSLANLIRTQRGDRPFRPDYGVDMERYLFQSGSLAENEINKMLYEAITKFEPRVVITRIESKYQNNGLEIKIDYVLRNRNIVQNFNTIITRTT